MYALETMTNRNNASTHGRAPLTPDAIEFRVIPAVFPEEYADAGLPGYTYEYRRVRPPGKEKRWDTYMYVLETSEECRAAALKAGYVECSQ